MRLAQNIVPLQASFALGHNLRLGLGFREGLGQVFLHRGALVSVGVRGGLGGDFSEGGVLFALLEVFKCFLQGLGCESLVAVVEILPLAFFTKSHVFFADLFDLGEVVDGEDALGEQGGGQED